MRLLRRRQHLVLTGILRGRCRGTRVEWVVRGCSTHCWVLREHTRPPILLGGQGVVSVPDRFEVIPQALVGREISVGRETRVWLVSRVSGCLGWLFENCTVDASIFVVKLLRENGGCLGIRSR